MSQTPVPALTWEAERELLAVLERDPPAAILVVSDLHVGKGIDPDTGRFFRRENFFADDAFRRFLRDHATRAREPALLVLNGDIFDFLRIDDYPRDAAARDQWAEMLARLGETGPPPGITRHERRFGLHTDPAKCVYKLDIIVRGHPVFFQTLAEWVGRGGWIMFVKGNHDLEVHWSLVRRAARDAIHRAGAAADAVAQRVVFVADAASLGNLHLEHGHNYETMTRVVGDPALPGRAARLNLPLGSFVNRYIINRMERVEPFLDNIKPVTDVLRAMVRRRPVALLEIVWHGAWLLARALLRRRVRHALLGVIIVGAALTYLVPVAAVAGALLFVASAGFRQWVVGLPFLGSASVRVALSVGGVLLPFLVAAVREIWRKLSAPRVGEDALAAGVYQRLRRNSGGAPSWRVRYAVLGHTHHHDVQVLPAINGAATRYLNAGTWTPLWPKDRPDLTGRTLYSFLRFVRTGGEYTHEALVWDDVAEQERPARLLTPR